jgi:ribosomal protein L33
MSSFESVGIGVTLSVCAEDFLNQVKCRQVDSTHRMKHKTTWLWIAILMTLLGCGGGGGGGSPSVSPGGPSYVDSWPIYPALSVLATSYQNKVDSRIDKTALGKFNTDVNPTSVTFGDFFQEGQMSAFVVVNRSGAVGQAYFLRWKSSESKWVDDSARLLGDGTNGNRDACTNSKYAITSDFNGDGKPDVYLSCGVGTQTEYQPIFLSQVDGTYVRRSSGIRLNGRTATASLINDDAYLDLLVTNLDTGIPEVWVGNGLGTFTSNATGTSGRLVSSGTCIGIFKSIPTNVQIGTILTIGTRQDLVLANTTHVAYLRDLGTSTSTRYSICQADVLALPTTADATDIYAPSTATDAVQFYLTRKNTSANPQTLTISKYGVTLSVSGGVTYYTLSAGLHPVTVTADSSDGLSDLVTLKDSAFKAFDAGCLLTTNRCSWHINLADVY